MIRSSYFLTLLKISTTIYSTLNKSYIPYTHFQLYEFIKIILRSQTQIEFTNTQESSIFYALYISNVPYLTPLQRKPRSTPAIQYRRVGGVERVWNGSPRWNWLDIVEWWHDNASIIALHASSAADEHNPPTISTPAIGAMGDPANHRGWRRGWRMNGRLRDSRVIYVYSAICVYVWETSFHTRARPSDRQTVRVPSSLL